MTCEAPSGYGKGRGTFTAHVAALYVSIQEKEDLIRDLKWQIDDLEQEIARLEGAGG